MLFRRLKYVVLDIFAKVFLILSHSEIDISTVVPNVFVSFLSMEIFE